MVSGRLVQLADFANDLGFREFHELFNDVGVAVAGVDSAVAFTLVH